MLTFRSFALLVFQVVLMLASAGAFAFGHEVVGCAVLVALVFSAVRFPVERSDR